MHNTIALEFIHKVTYGKERFYPSSKDSIALSRLMKVKTLTRQQLEICKKNGWEVIVIVGYKPFQKI